MIKLRHLTIEDSKDYWLAHDKISEKNFNSIPKNIQQARKEVNKHIKHYSVPVNKREEECFAIEYNGEFAGWINIHDISYEHKAVTGSLVAPHFRKKGVGTKAHKILIKHAFKKYKLKRISGRLRAFNKASGRMLEKSGYKFEGRNVKDYKRNGRYYDHLVSAITR